MDTRPEAARRCASVLHVRPTRRLTGTADGVQLDDLVPGSVYAVGLGLGCYLIHGGAAEPVADNTPALTPPPEQQVSTTTDDAGAAEEDGQTDKNRRDRSTPNTAS